MFPDATGIATTGMVIFGTAMRKTPSITAAFAFVMSCVALRLSLIFNDEEGNATTRRKKWAPHRNRNTLRLQGAVALYGHGHVFAGRAWNVHLYQRPSVRFFRFHASVFSFRVVVVSRRRVGGVVEQSRSSPKLHHRAPRWHPPRRKTSRPVRTRARNPTRGTGAETSSTSFLPLLLLLFFLFFVVSFLRLIHTLKEGKRAMCVCNFGAQIVVVFVVIIVCVCVCVCKLMETTHKKRRLNLKPLTPLKKKTSTF